MLKQRVKVVSMGGTLLLVSWAVSLWFCLFRDVEIVEMVDERGGL